MVADVVWVLKYSVALEALEKVISDLVAAVVSAPAGPVVESSMTNS